MKKCNQGVFCGGEKAVENMLMLDGHQILFVNIYRNLTFFLRTTLAFVFSVN